MKIKKAIITAAGYGTRFFPITKTIQKEMLPILDKPIIDYIVDDCIKAGIEEIVFVIKPNDTQIRDYYSEKTELLEYLRKMNKLEKYEKIKELHTKARFKFLIQSPELPYGTGTPIKLAKDVMQGEESFLALMGDDFIFNEDGSSEIKKIIDSFQKTQAVGLITCREIEKNDVTKYGIADIVDEDGIKYLKNIVEKPSVEESPTNLANISKYVFTSEIFNILETQKINPESNELFITDSISLLQEKGRIVVHKTEGEYMDSGDLAGWLKANMIMSKARKIITA